MRVVFLLFYRCTTHYENACIKVDFSCYDFSHKISLRITHEGVPHILIKTSSAYLFPSSINRSNTEMMLDSAVEVVETNPTDISTNDTADNRLDTSTSGESNSTSYIKSALLCRKH